MKTKWNSFNASRKITATVWVFFLSVRIENKFVFARCDWQEKIDLILNKFSKKGSTEIWTRIAGFKVQSANHYTMEPHDVNEF